MKHLNMADTIDDLQLFGWIRILVRDENPIGKAF